MVSKLFRSLSLPAGKSDHFLVFGIILATLLLLGGGIAALSMSGRKKRAGKKAKVTKTVIESVPVDNE